MREIIRFGVQVALCMALCAGLITGMSALTAKTDSSLRLVQQAIAPVLPASATVDHGHLASGMFDYWEIKRGSACIGYVFKQSWVTPAGVIACVTAVDSGGRILALVPCNESALMQQRILDAGHSTTPGTRCRTYNAWFFEQFTGLSIIQPIQVAAQPYTLAAPPVGQNILLVDQSMVPVAEAIVKMLQTTTTLSLAIVQGKS